MSQFLLDCVVGNAQNPLSARELSQMTGLKPQTCFKNIRKLMAKNRIERVRVENTVKYRKVDGKC